MAIQFYRTSDDPNKVEKRLEIIGDPVDVRYMDATDAESPSYRMNFSPNYFDANYLYDSITGRFYFVEPPIIEPGGSVVYKCKEDYLMTHKAEILALVCTVARNENNSDGYLVDNEYKIKAYKQYVTKTFPSGLNNNSLVLITLG